MHHISLSQAHQNLQDSGELFKVLFQHGTLSVEFYQPQLVDQQQPHSRDEIYLIATGRASFVGGAQIVQVQKGDFLFVPAYEAHHFFDFSPDFAVWVFFYGVEGGEKQ